MTLRLSVLDQSTASAGRPEDAAIRDTIALAQMCDDLGYARFWVAEHHNHPTILGTAPEILMAAIAQATKRIRIGSAGVMLPHYAPLKVAEQFRVLDAIAPGRIDLGLGRAPGSDGKTAYALNPNAAQDAENFPANVRDLVAWVTGAPLLEGHPFAGLAARPMADTAPEVWMLGTSDYGARVAAVLGLPYCFAHFITDGRGTGPVLDLYRRGYSPSARHPEPQAAICVWALAADSREAARDQVASRTHWKLARERGAVGPLQAPDDLRALERSGADAVRLAQLESETIFGDAAEVGDRLRGMAEEYGVDEIAVLTWAHDQAVRRRSYELLAAEFGQ